MAWYSLQLIKLKSNVKYVLSQSPEFTLKHHHPELNTSHTVIAQFKRREKVIEIINHRMNYILQFFDCLVERVAAYKIVC